MTWFEVLSSPSWLWMENKCPAKKPMKDLWKENQEIHLAVLKKKKRNLNTEATKTEMQQHPTHGRRRWRIKSSDFWRGGCGSKSNVDRLEPDPLFSASLHLFPDLLFLVLHPHWTPLPQVKLSSNRSHMTHHLPVLDGVEGLLVGDVVHEDEAHGSSVVGRGDGAVTLLACRVLEQKEKFSQVLRQRTITFNF